MILVDTSVWIDHLHATEGTLVELLERNEVLCHPMVIGELALGSLRSRANVLALLRALPRCAQVSDDEVLTFIDARALWSTSLSLVDVYLLASVMVVEGAALWSRDRRLAQAAADLSVLWEPRTDA